MRLNNEQPRLTLFTSSLSGGGVERVMVNLARGFAGHGLKVDLVLAKAEGPYISQVPSGVRVVDLQASRVLTSLPNLVLYLKRERPSVFITGSYHVNIIAIWARIIAGVSCKLVVTVHNTLSQGVKNARDLKGQLLPYFVRMFYPRADVVVAVSQGVADDLVKTTGLPRELIKVIYNPVVTPELLEKAKVSIDHPWFRPGQPPVILSVGRLTKQKDFPTLIRAFALVRTERSARLMILGEGEERPKLEALVRELGLEDDVSMPGFVDNPYAYMARAAVFVLSSLWEGLPTVLIEAMAVGTPVVSTDCPSGPSEILMNGKYGSLVPVGDHSALAKAIRKNMEIEMKIKNDCLVEAVKPFMANEVYNQWMEVIGITK